MCMICKSSIWRAFEASLRIMCASDACFVIYDYLCIIYNASLLEIHAIIQWLKYVLLICIPCILNNTEKKGSYPFRRGYPNSSVGEIEFRAGKWAPLFLSEDCLIHSPKQLAQWVADAMAELSWCDYQETWTRPFGREYFANAQNLYGSDYTNHHNFLKRVFVFIIFHIHF